MVLLRSPGWLRRARASLLNCSHHTVRRREGTTAIERMAYGYRDDADFFFKIRAAFPGVGR